MVKILVAEDDKALCDLVCAMLRSNGYEAVACADGAEALLAAEDQPFDLIISDVMMPRMDGFELARAIREVTADGETYRRYSSGAEARYREWFTKERMIDQCLTLYSEIYEKRGRECIFQSGTDAHGGRQL